jgi:hypothetical protein
MTYSKEGAYATDFECGSIVHFHNADNRKHQNRMVLILRVAAQVLADFKAPEGHVAILLAARGTTRSNEQHWGTKLPYKPR